jgi:pimeloyl-ACP methyl ester carboxylesterase
MAGQFRLSKTALCTVAIAAACAATAGTALAGNDSKRHKSIELEAQGSFYVAGKIFNIPSRIASGTTPEPGLISIDHAYVQYQIPEDKKYRFPVLMVHGGGHTGKTYETTPDGREGWYTSFTRRGFPSYVIDDPNRGRACCEPTELHLVRMGLLPNTALPNMNIYTKEAAYTTFRFGPAYPTAYAGQRFPLGAIDQYAPQWVLTYRDAEENAKITNAIIAAIDKIGPCIVLVHSQSGPLGLAAVLQRTNLVKGFVAIEPAGFAIPATETAAKLKNVPIFAVFGDNLASSPQSTGWLTSAQTTADQVNASGGNAKVLPLATIGIRGNSHMMMMDNNNEQIADIIEKWVAKNVRKALDDDHNHGHDGRD